MPKEEVDTQPDPTQNDAGENAAQTETGEDVPAILPEKSDQEAGDIQKQIDELKASSQLLQTEKAVWQKEKELLEKRLKDTQNEFHARRDDRSRQVEDLDHKPKETLAEYKARIKEKLTDDPGEAIDILIEDLAKDRFLLENKLEERIRQAEQNAYQRALRSDPQRSKLLREVEDLASERPDLANLTFDQKMEFVEMRQKSKADATPAPDRQSNSTRRAQALVQGSRRRGSSDSSGLPDWTADPEVQKRAKNQGFSSREELSVWENVNNAEDAERILAKMRKEK